MKNDSDFSVKILWDVTARQKMIRWHTRAIVLNAAIMAILLAASHVDVIITRKQIAISQFISTTSSVLFMTAIIYSAMQLRRIGQIIERDEGHKDSSAKGHD